MVGGRIPLGLFDGRRRVLPGNLAKKLARGGVSVTVGGLGGTEPRCFPMAFPPPPPRKAGKRKRETLAASPQSQPCVKHQFLAVLGPGSIEYRETAPSMIVSTLATNRCVHLDDATLREAGAAGAVPPALDAAGIRLPAIRRNAPQILPASPPVWGRAIRGGAIRSGLAACRIRMNVQATGIIHADAGSLTRRSGEGGTRSGGARQSGGGLRGRIRVSNGRHCKIQLVPGGRAPT